MNVPHTYLLCMRNLVLYYYIEKNLFLRVRNNFFYLFSQGLHIHRLFYNAIFFYFQYTCTYIRSILQCYLLIFSVYTYIQSRFYRSPEVILGLPYSMPIDMWSFGCILAELYTGYPLFPGEDEVEQLACIMEVMGLPPSRVLEASSRRRLFFGEFNPCNVELFFYKPWKPKGF